jgi:N-acetylglutamate synthase-like GNAT family acetyltransferase
MFSIRKARLEDCASIARVHTDAVRAIRPGIYSPEELESWQRPRKAEDYQQSIQNKEFLVATSGEQIVAFGVLNPETGEIEALYTSPTVRGSGAGMKLIQSLEQKAQELGLSALSLNASLNAVGFYEIAGFMAQPESTYRLATGLEIRCVPMIKSLMRNLTTDGPS